MFGVLPAPFKLLHYHTKGFADTEGQVFLDIYRSFPSHIVVVDGTISYEGYAPVAGKPKETNFIITSNDALSADFALAEIIGFTIKDIAYLRAAISAGFNPSYILVGSKPQAVVSGTWKKPRWRTGGLALNLVSIFREHVRVRRKG